MGRLVVKLCWFSMLPIMMNIFLGLVLPSDFFTFRSWETLRVFSADLFEGPFYPNQRMDQLEVGDLGKGTAYAISRQVEFITDDYGFRNSHQRNMNYPIVIVGDSMTAGGGLTQTDTLTEILAGTINQAVYNYAPAEPIDFLVDEYFQTSPPQIVILQVVERHLLNDFCPQKLTEKTPVPIFGSLTINQKVVIDGILRTPFYLLPYIKSNFAVRPKVPIVNSNRMIFYNSSISSPDQSAMSVEEMIDSLRRCEAIFAEHDIDFIFLPVPDKENVYFDQIPADARPPISNNERRDFYNEIITQARAKDITTVNLLNPFLDARAKGHVIYQLDDTHWNSIGISIAVEQIVPLLSN